jgi:urea transport system permease protein
MLARLGARRLTGAIVALYVLLALVLAVLGALVPEYSAVHLSFTTVAQIVNAAAELTLAAFAVVVGVSFARLVRKSPLDRQARIFIIALLAAAVLVPILNQLVPPTWLFYVPTHWVQVLGKYLCYAVLALAVDLIWGYCGILSLGHGAFFALGGYAMGMYLMRQIGTRGVYAHPVLPDFMVFLNWKELPFFWNFFDHFPYAVLMAIVVPGLLALVFGYFAFRSRVTGVYLSIITQALTYALMLGFFRNNFGFGGNNGLTDFKDILGYPVQSDGVRVCLFALSALLLALMFLLAHGIVTSKLGKVLVSIRDAESRTRFLGYRVERYKTFAFTASAIMAAIAGALYVPQVGIINPSEFQPLNSIEIVVWVAVGGRGTLIGAALGALIVNMVKYLLTGGTLAAWAGAVFGLIAGSTGASFGAYLFAPDKWLFALGTLFVVVTVFVPDGLLGLLRRRKSLLPNGEADPAPLPQPAE